MKKTITLLLVLMLMLPVLPALAASEYLPVGIAATQDKYAYLISEAIEKSEYAEEHIDKEHIYIIENTTPMPMRKNEEPIWIWVALPLLDSSDISYAYFDKGGYGMAITNFTTFDGLEKPYGDTLKQYIEKNNLSEPTEITNMWIIERVHLFAYNVICDDEEYIIPCYFTEDSMFNLTNSEECNIEIGKAYTNDDFLSICEKEAELFAEHRKSEGEQEETDSSKTYVDNDGEIVMPEPDVKDETEEKNDDSNKLSDEKELKNDTENTDKPIFIDYSDWSKEYIVQANNLGFLDDISDISYKEPVPREKFCEIVYNMLIKTTDKSWAIPTAIPFDDTFNTKVSTLYYEGIIKGKGDKTFAPNDFLSREEAATLLYRVAEYMGKDIPQSSYDETVPFFTDKNLISNWAFDAIFYMNKMRIMVGTSDIEFSPKETYSAEQAIATIIRLYNY